MNEKLKEIPSAALAILDSDKNFEDFMKTMEKVQICVERTLASYPPSAFLILDDDTVCLRRRWINRFLSSIPLPLKIINIRPVKVDNTANGYRVFAYMADVVNDLTGLSIAIYNEESSDKDFYSTKEIEGKRIKLYPEQVNLRDVREAAYVGLKKEVLRVFFGLRNLSIKEAEDIGIKTKNIFRVPLEGG